jgi:hypothetical protein
MDQNYTLSVTDADGNTIIAGEGKVKVFYYLAENAAAELEELGSGVDVTATIRHGDTQVLNATIDAESAASLIKGRSLRIRRSLATPAENAPTVG